MPGILTETEELFYSRPCLKYVLPESDNDNLLTGSQGYAEFDMSATGGTWTPSIDDNDIRRYQVSDILLRRDDSLIGVEVGIFLADYWLAIDDCLVNPARCH